MLPAVMVNRDRWVGGILVSRFLTMLYLLRPKLGTGSGIALEADMLHTRRLLVPLFFVLLALLGGCRSDRVEQTTATPGSGGGRSARPIARAFGNS